MSVYRHALQVVAARLGDVRQMNAEFTNVCKWDGLISHSVDASQRPENKHKNRYCNVLPYDQNRVELAQPSGYINASHVAFNESGPGGVVCSYISAQGPLTSTVADFWGMALETRASAIVMLTNIIENNVSKCVAYFPPSPGKVINAGDGLEVRCTHMEELGSEVTMRSMQITRMGATTTTATVPHYHFHSWPDHGTPQESAAIRTLCDALPADRAGQPVIVHCSAGIGRTGTFIAIDVVRMRLHALKQTADKVRTGVRVCARV
jgi:protein tyrosine phosphatase